MQRPCSVIHHSMECESGFHLDIAFWNHCPTLDYIGEQNKHGNSYSYLMKCALILTALWTMMVKCQKINPLILREGETNEESAKCVLKLSAKYFVDKKAMSGSIVIININSDLSTTQKTLLETIHGGKKYSVMVKDSAYKHKNASLFPEKAKNYMMILESKEELLRNILQLNKLPTWNPHAKAVIYIELKKPENLESLVKGIINELRNYKLLKTIVLVNFPEKKEIVSYTWKPYSDTNCGGICDSIVILDVCRNYNIYEMHKTSELIPRNMQQCPLTVYTVISEPYVMPPENIKSGSSYDDEYAFDLGIEINIMKIIAHFTNMSLIIRMSNKTEDWGKLELDGNSTGLFEKLKSEQVDVIIGNMEVNKNIRKWFDPSSTYMQDDVTWCVPKASTASTWTNLITIFKLSTWMTTFSAIILMSLIFHWFMYRERSNVTIWPTNSILMTLSMVLGWGALFKPKSTAFRIILFSWLLFSININTSYQSFLRSFLIHPKYNKQISTDSEIISANYKLGGKATLKEYFSGNDYISSYVRDNYETCESFQNCIKKVGFDRNFAVAASRRQAIYQDQHLGKGSSLIYCFQEGNVIYKYAVVILTRKWFPMLSRFNIIIRSVSENGLIWKWNSEVFLHQNTMEDVSDMVPLGMEHMLGAFLFLLMSYVTCTSVLMIEIFIYKINKYLLKRAKHKFYNKNNNIVNVQSFKIV